VTFGGNKFNDFPDYQPTKFGVVWPVKANREQYFPTRGYLIHGLSWIICPVVVLTLTYTIMLFIGWSRIFTP